MGVRQEIEDITLLVIHCAATPNSMKALTSTTVFILALATAPHTNAQGISEALRQMMIDEVRENGDKGNDYAKMEKDCEGRICTYQNQPKVGKVVYRVYPYGEQVVVYHQPYYGD